MVRSVAICKTYEMGARVETLFYTYASVVAPEFRLSRDLEMSIQKPEKYIANVSWKWWTVIKQNASFVITKSVRSAFGVLDFIDDMI